MPNPFKWVWDQIKGNLISWLLAPVGAAVLGALVWFGQQFPPNAILPGAVCIVSATLFFFLLSKVSASGIDNMKANEIAQAIAQAEDEIEERDHYGRFSIEVLEGYVGLSPRLRQTVKTLLTVRCKFIVPDPGTDLGWACR